MTISSDRSTADQFYAVNMVATAPFDVTDTPYSIYIREKETGQIRAICATGIQCTTALRSSTADTFHYDAWVGNYNNGPTHRQTTLAKPWSLTWSPSTNIRIEAYDAISPVDQPSFLYVTTGADVTNSQFQIYIQRVEDQAIVAVCDTGDGCEAGISNNVEVTQHFIAWVGNEADGSATNVQGQTTDTVPVKWFQGAPDDNRDLYERCGEPGEAGDYMCFWNGSSGPVNTKASGGKLSAQTGVPFTCGDDYYNLIRKRSCGEFRNFLFVYDNRGAQEGYASYRVKIDEILSAKATSYLLKVTYTFDTVVGQASIAQLDGLAICEDCVESGSLATSPGLFNGKTVNATYTIDAGSIATGAIVPHSTSIASYFSAPTYGISTPVIIQYQPPVRCDNALPGNNTVAGCIFPNTWPVLGYSRTGPYPELARHIADAQASGLPGSSDTYRPLRRASNTVSAISRAIACPQSLPRPDAQHSCDEYPFASTYSGALFTSGGPRTFDYCQIAQTTPPSTGLDGYSRCMIDADQNSSGGTNLNQQFVNNRILVQDEFLFDIAP